jgi:hypothetical protein
MRPIVRTARPSSSMLARSAARASCRSALGRPIGRAAPITGSRSKTRTRRQCGGSKKKIGPDVQLESDLNDGKPWSNMASADLKNHAARFDVAMKGAKMTARRFTPH